MIIDREKIIQKVAQFAENLLEQDLPDSMYFHNFAHTQLVVHGVKEIARGCGVSEDEYLILVIAAYLHDVGYTVVYKNHEQAGAAIARDFLLKIGLENSKIEEIEKCILATRYPQQPSGLLEEIICDADFYHFSLNDYLSYASSLKQEWENRLGVVYAEDEWDLINYEMLSAHRYFTPYARTILQKRKEENLEKINKNC